MLDKITNWQQTAARARANQLPLIVMIDQEDCPYCRRVEGEFFAALFAAGEYDDKAIFGKLTINGEEDIIDDDGVSVLVDDFLADQNTRFTPTILFMDADRNELADRMIGLSTPDFYGFYLERAIRRSINALNPHSV